MKSRCSLTPIWAVLLTLSVALVVLVVPGARPAEARSCSDANTALNPWFYGGTGSTSAYFDYTASSCVSDPGPVNYLVTRTRTSREVPWTFWNGVCDYDSYHKVDDSRSGYATTYRHFSQNNSCSFSAWFNSYSDRWVGDRSWVYGYWKDSRTGHYWRHLSSAPVDDRD